MCACSGEAAARRGYDAVKLAAAYDIPGHGEHGLLGGRGKYSNLEIFKGSTVAFASKVLPYAKSKLDTMKPGLHFIL